MMKKDYMNRFFWTVPVLAALAAVAGCSKQELVPAEGSGTGEPLPEAVAAKAVNAIAGADRTSLLLYFDDEVLESIAAGQVTKTASSKEGPVSGVEDIDRILKETGAVSTDYESPESADVLCDRTTPYAETWKPTADELWANTPKKK